MGDLAGSRGCISCCHSETTRCRDPGRANSPLPGAAGLRWLAGPLVEFSSWPEVPTADLGRSEEGSVNLAAALQVWQTRDFSSASRSAKLKMCLARNPPLIFFFFGKFDPHAFDLFLFNSSCRIRSYNDEGNSADFQEGFLASFLRTKSPLPHPTISAIRLSWVCNFEPKCERDPCLAKMKHSAGMLLGSHGRKAGAGWGWATRTGRESAVLHWMV